MKRLGERPRLRQALRTVKSCVGEATWVRYGVQDSVAFAIRVEKRYRGSGLPTRSGGRFGLRPRNARRPKARTLADRTERATTLRLRNGVLPNLVTPICCGRY